MVHEIFMKYMSFVLFVTLALEYFGWVYKGPKTDMIKPARNN